VRLCAAGRGKVTNFIRRVPRVIWLFLGSTLAARLLLPVWPGAIPWFVLRSGPGVGYRLLSYPWVVPSLGLWLWSSAILVLSGLLMAPRTSERGHFLLLSLSTLFGAAAFLALSDGQVFAGPGLVAWGYLGAGAGYGIMHWSGLSRGWKAYVVLSLIGMANGVLTWTLENRVQSVTAAAAGCVVILWFTRNRTEAPDPPTEDALRSTGGAAL